MKYFIISIGLFFLSATCLSQKVSEEALKKANNPLADMIALNFHNYFIPLYSEAPKGFYSNNFWIRYAQPFAKGRLLVRASLPLATLTTDFDSLGRSTTKTGLGDANIFMSYNFISRSNLTIGVGPLIATPSATERELGSGKWQAGAAFVAFVSSSPVFQYGCLITWQMSFAGDSQRQNTNLGAFQPFLMWQLGNGTYLRTAPIWLFDFEKQQYHTPFSVGIGKILRVNRTVFNLFIEPQYSFLHKGTQPTFQIFAGMNLQFTKKQPEKKQ